MDKRGWNVGSLSEFFPQNPGLLGLNVGGGLEIKIRMRPARDVGSFIPFRNLVGTMLHELIHNDIGPHNAAFYKMYDALWEEYEELENSGKLGNGPDGTFGGIGRKVGDGSSRNISGEQAKIMRAKAAEKRRLNNDRMGSGRLGGNGSELGQFEKILSPQEMAAVAAERRMIMLGADACGTTLVAEGERSSGSVAIPKQVLSGLEVSAANPSSTPGDIIIIDDSDDDFVDGDKGMDNNGAEILINTSSPVLITRPTSKVVDRRPSAEGQSQPVKRPKIQNPSASSISSSNWPCLVCTFSNPRNVSSCEMCGMPREPQTLWSCPQCSFQNDVQWRLCQICEYLRSA